MREKIVNKYDFEKNIGGKIYTADTVYLTLKPLFQNPMLLRNTNSVAIRVSTYRIYVINGIFTIFYYLLLAVSKEMSFLP